MPNGQYEISSREIEVSGSLTLDEVLQQAPGFSKFNVSPVEQPDCESDAARSAGVPCAQPK
jgi:hypothetical protein